MLRNFFKVWKPADKPEPGASPVGIFNSPSLSPTISVLLFALVAWTFLPSLHNGFVSYDDARYIAANKHVTEGLNWENVRWAFTTTAVSNWHPVTWLSHMLDCSLFGLRPWGHHLTSVLLHAANSVLLFLFLLRVSGAAGASLFVAAVFGVHPLRVESVAWAAERKDALSAFFGLLALIFYARRFSRGEVGNIQQPTSDNQSPTRKKAAMGTSRPHPAASTIPALVSRPSTLDYLLALLFFALSLMSKPMLVTLPFLLLLLDYWPLGRFDGRAAARPYHRRILLEKLPFLALATASCVITFVAQKQAMTWMAQTPLLERAGNAFVSYWRYLGKLFWPTHLSVIYPLVDWPAAVAWGAFAAWLAACIAAVALRRRAPYLFTGWFWFIGTLVPVIGIVAVGEQSMADRYTYIPSVGILIILAWAAQDLFGRRSWQAAKWVAGVGIVIACIIVTRQNLQSWKNTEALFTHAVRSTRNNYRACVNLGAELYSQHRVGEALEYFQAAVTFRPDSPEAHMDLGVALHAENRTEDAIHEFQKALELRPEYPEARFNLKAAMDSQ